MLEQSHIWNLNYYKSLNDCSPGARPRAEVAFDIYFIGMQINPFTGQDNEQSFLND